MSAPARLFLVATPIGNLEDISLRALRILKTVDVIAAEDTRRTQKLLAHYDIHKPLTSYYKDVEHRKTEALLDRLAQGQSVALVTDAGMPGISDPGVALVREARQRQIPLEVIPGPSAVLTALAGSGLGLDTFTFHGFLDAKPKDRRKTLADYRSRPETQVFFLSPHRLQESLQDLAEAWGERAAVLCRELTKVHEEFRPGTLAELVVMVGQQEPRGEYTLVVAGAGPEQQTAPAATDESVEEQLQRLQQEGLPLNQAVARVSRERRLPRDQVYHLAHHLPKK